VVRGAARCWLGDRRAASAGDAARARSGVGGHLNAGRSRTDP
jgi:hypothetical protein